MGEISPPARVVSGWSALRWDFNQPFARPPRGRQRRIRVAATDPFAQLAFR